MMPRSVALLVAVVWVMSGSDSSAAPPKVGDPAPEFSLPGSDGKTYRLSQLRGKVVVLAWFPKAFTGG